MVTHETRIREVTGSNPRPAEPETDMLPSEPTRRAHVQLRHQPNSPGSYKVMDPRYQINGNVNLRINVYWSFCTSFSLYFPSVNYRPSPLKHFV